MSAYVYRHFENVSSRYYLCTRDEEINSQTGRDIDGHCAIGEITNGYLYEDREEVTVTGYVIEIDSIQALLCRMGLVRIPKIKIHRTQL